VSDSLAGLSVSSGSDLGYIEQPARFTIDLISGGVFDLWGFDAGQAFGASGGTLTVTGTLAAGGAVNAVFTTTSGVLESYAFGPEWSGLSQVDVLSSSDMLAIDRVEVPEPGNLLLWISGMVALVGAQRHRSRRRTRKAPGTGPDSTERHSM
jgi:hypothetical protein